jgi:hypothetical protein
MYGSGLHHASFSMTLEWPLSTADQSINAHGWSTLPAEME